MKDIPSRLAAMLWIAAIPIFCVVSSFESLRADAAALEAPAPHKSLQAVSASQQMVFEYWPAGLGQPQGPNSKYEIAVANLDGSNFKQITNDGAQKFLPHFSPDASKIVYTEFTRGGFGAANALSEVVVYDVATAKQTVLTSGGISGYPTWSPDGSRIAYLKNVRLGQTYGGTEPTTLMTMGVDGSKPQKVGAATGNPNDWLWGDIAWSKQNWILFVVGEVSNGAFCKSRVDKILPDGSSRTQVSDGGANCTPPGSESVGDSDPSWSSDGTTIYSSRGFATTPVGGPRHSTERRLYAFSSAAWYPGKSARDLSLPLEPSCIEAVPKASPDGAHIMVFRACFDTGVTVLGLYETNTTGSYRTLVGKGFGPDWQPVLAAAK